MINPRHAMAFGLVLLIPAVSHAEPAVPVVPASVMTTEPEGRTPARNPFASVRDKSRETGPRILKSSFKPLELIVQPGINQVLPVAIGHFNRIVTPYDSPFIQTVSNAVIEPHENVVYVATEDEFPVTLYITPDVGDESHAISLTLQPSAIPPVEATLKLDGGAAASYFSRKKAQKFEEGHPYTESIKKMMRSLALGQIPDGYGIGPMKAGDMLPHCDQRGMEYDFLNGQYLRGHHFHVAVGTVKNRSGEMLEVDETACLNGQIAAVAAWPDVYLNPGQTVELFVAMRFDLKPHARKERRSLLLGQPQSTTPP